MRNSEKRKREKAAQARCWLDEGWPLYKVAVIVGTSPTTLARWLRRYNPPCVNVGNVDAFPYGPAGFAAACFPDRS